MAQGNAKPHHEQYILSDVAASEAALDIEIQMAFRRYEALYYNVKMKDVEIAAKEEKNKQLDELIEAKKSELDEIVKQREDMRKRTSSLRRSIDNSQQLLKFYEKQRIEKRKLRELIIARYQVLIDRRKEKINSYPLVVERNKLRNELLAANVELGVLKYRVTEKRKQEKQMKQIKQKLLNNAIVKLAQSYVDVEKLKEKNSKLLEELEKAKSLSITSKEQDKRNSTETTVTDGTNAVPTGHDTQAVDSSSKNVQPTRYPVKTNEIDGVIQNFREKFQVKMQHSSSVSLPPVLLIEKRANSLKSVENNGNTEQVIPPSHEERSNKMENIVTNCEDLSRMDKECNPNNYDEETFPKRGGRSAKNFDVSNESEYEANIRLRNALIATKSRNRTTASTSSSERKRVLIQNTMQRGVKTDDYVPPKRLYDNSQYPSSSTNPIDQGRGGRFYEPVALHSGNQFNGRTPSVRKIPSATRVQKEMECALPEDIESRPTAARETIIPSAYFNETAMEANERGLPVQAVLEYGYDKYDENELNRDNNEPNPDAGVYLTRGIEKRYTNHEIPAGERRNAEDECVEQEYVAEDEYPGRFQFSSGNGDRYENYSDHNDEIDADDEHADGGFARRTHPSDGSSKEKLSSGAGKHSSFGSDPFRCSPEDRPRPNFFESIFNNQNDNTNPENFSMF